MANSRRGPPKKRSDFAFGTPSYFKEREKQLKTRQRGQLLAASRGSKKAARGARETEKRIAATRERANIAQRVQQQIEAAGEAQGPAMRRRLRFRLRSFSRLPAAERQKVRALLAEFGNRPVPRNVDTGLSSTGWWLFFQAGGQTG